MAKLSETIHLPIAYVATEITTMFNTYHPWPCIPERAQWELHGKTHDRIEVRVHGESWGDHRRYWRLFSVWLDGKPVLAGRHAGREGDDSVDRVIIDRDLYLQLAQIIATMLPISEDETEINGLLADSDIGSLTRWYGEHIEAGKVLRDLGWRG